jgi:DNA-binding NtrC family response regulator
MLEPEESTLLIRRPKEFSAPAQSGIASLPPDDERERFIRALELCGGNQTRAAQMLGVSRRTLINRLDRWKLPRPQKR